MNHTVNTTHVRFINQQAILNAIFKAEGISKAELARSLNMSKPSMADNVNELLQIGIIRESGQGQCGSGGGRKPVLLSFCDDFRYIIAMDFHYEYSTFTLSDLRGTIVNEFTIHQTPLSDFDAWITLCLNAISMLMVSQNISYEHLAAIAVAAPGVLNSSEGTYIISSKYGEFDVEVVKQRLSEEFPVPVLVKNSTNAAALGELYYGEGQGHENIVYISCGQGVGSGIILQGQLYEGSHLAAGEIGSCITPESLKTPRMSLEDRICIESVLKRVNEDERFMEAPIGFSGMVKQWGEEDPQIRRMVDEVAVELGCAIVNLLSAIDCELVILGGEYLVFGEQVFPALNRLVSDYCVVPVPVTAARLGVKASTLGLIATCREFYFEQLCTRE